MLIKKWKSFNEELELKFKKKSDPKKDKVYLYVMYEGGDADTKHPEKYDLGIKYSEIESRKAEIEKKVDRYKKLKRILDINCSDYCDDYETVMSKFGKELAGMFDCTPNDPQNDYQNKCYIDYIKIIAYDEEGSKHESWV